MERCLLYSITFISLFLLDRITKYVALSHAPVEVCRYLTISLSWNRGISWGMFDGTSRLGFVVLTAFIATVLIFFLLYVRAVYKEGRPIWYEIMVLAGAVSNMIDRVYYGAVIDFIDVHVGAWHWPTFNIADACIVLGVGGMLVSEGMIWKRQKK